MRRGAPFVARSMRTLTLHVVLPFLGLLAAPLAQDPAPPPGYSGTFPSEAAQEVLRGFASKPWEDKDKRLGGGTWQLQAGAVTPHALGPCRGDVMVMRETTVKGPHLRLWRDHLGVCFPTTTDGDVAATLRWLGQEVPAGIAGEPTPAWRRAAARLDALGLGGTAAEVAGLRAGLVVDPERPRCVELVLWKTGTGKEPVTGKAALKVDGEGMAIDLVWPVKKEAIAGRSELVLAPGNTFVRTLDVDELLKGKGKPELQEGVRLLQFEMTCRAGTGTEAVLATPRLQLMIAGPNGVK